MSEPPSDQTDDAILELESPLGPLPLWSRIRLKSRGTRVLCKVTLVLTLPPEQVCSQPFTAAWSRALDLLCWWAWPPRPHTRIPSGLMLLGRSLGARAFPLQLADFSLQAGTAEHPVILGLTLEHSPLGDSRPHCVELFWAPSSLASCHHRLFLVMQQSHLCVFCPDTLQPVLFISYPHSHDPNTLRHPGDRPCHGQIIADCYQVGVSVVPVFSEFCRDAKQSRAWEHLWFCCL